MPPEIRWRKLLEEAVNEAGAFIGTYTRYYNYSFLNCVFLQLQGAKGPVASHSRWLQLGRSTKPGTSKFWICFPRIVKEIDENGEETEKFVGYGYSKCIVQYADTIPVKKRGEDPVSMGGSEGAGTTGNDTAEVESTLPELPVFETPRWDLRRALAKLDISEVAFEHVDGNVQGYSFERSFALNPDASFKFKTTIHEIAHICLGHTTEERDHRGIREFEAETVAYIVLHELDRQKEMNPGESRAYIQEWLGKRDGEGGLEVAEKHVKRIFSVVGRILNAGWPQRDESGKDEE